MAIYEGQAKLRMPQDVAALQSSWNGASIENTGRDDLARIATYGKNKAGNIIWSRLDGGPSFNEYPIRWYYDANGALQVLLEQEFGAIPDSKDAVVIFSGDASGSGDSFTFGEKPAIVKDIAALADGTQYYLEYFDFQEAAWKLNPDVLQAMVPAGYAVSQDESGNWIAAADNQALLQFDLAKKAWMEALPPLPSEFLAKYPDGGYEIVDGKVMVGDTVWYERGQDGQWQEKLFIYNRLTDTEIAQLDFSRLNQETLYVEDNNDGNSSKAFVNGRVIERGRLNEDGYGWYYIKLATSIGGQIVTLNLKLGIGTGTNITQMGGGHDIVCSLKNSASLNFGLGGFGYCNAKTLVDELKLGELITIRSPYEFPKELKDHYRSNKAYEGYGYDVKNHEQYNHYSEIFTFLGKLVNGNVDQINPEEWSVWLYPGFLVDK
jgi:hypothetical protein